MTHDDLRALVALADHGTFGRAAEHAHVSPSTLTRAVQRLEAGLGTKLVDRRPDGAVLTAAGRRAEAYARSVLTGWEALRREAGGDAGISGTLRLHCTVTAAQSIVPNLLRALRAVHPEINLELSTGDAAGALSRVLGMEVDAALAALPSRLPGGVVGRELRTIPLVVVRPVGAPRPEQWWTEPLVLPAAGMVRAEVDGWFRSRRRRPTVSAEADGHEAVLPLVAIGLGVGIVPALVLDASALRAELDVVPESSLPSLRIGLCALRRRLAEPTIGALWEVLG